MICSCGARLAAKDELAGKSVHCPKCKQLLLIPPAAPPPTTGVEDILEETGFQPTEAKTPVEVLRSLPPGDPKAPKAAPLSWLRSSDDPNWSDDDITAGDVLVCFMCAPVVLMYSLKLLVRGNPKGVKLFLICLMLNIAILTLLAMFTGP